MRFSYASRARGFGGGGKVAATVTVFAVLAPRTVPRKEGAPADDGGALSIEKQRQLQRIGQASDFAFCKGERRDGKPCGMWVNRAECEYCEFHAAAALRQLNKASAVAAASAEPSSAAAANLPPARSPGSHDHERACRALQHAHRVRPGQSWGSLDEVQIAEWKARRCDRFFCKPSAMEAVGKYVCQPL